VWPEYGKNVTSVGDLWYQMLRFYTEEFDFNEYVVSIKQKAKLGRFQKLWTSKCIAIEDPFDLNHNLGSGLSRKSMFLLFLLMQGLIKIAFAVNNFIIKAFRKGRMHFGTPIAREEVPPPYRELRVSPSYLVCLFYAEFGKTCTCLPVL
jgi:terminal uridylyltransferase